MKKTSSPVLLIDADVLVYQAAAGSEKIITWDTDTITPVCSLPDAMAAYTDKLERIKERLESGDVILCFSDSTEHNFRRKIYDPYKRNREGKPRPIGLKPLREAVIAVAPPDRTYIRPALEADDCLGILATHSRFRPGQKKIIASIDKDMRGIPSHFFNIGHPEEGVADISEPDANRWHMTQALIGDTADGYPGCPNVGPVKAARMLADCHTYSEMWPVVVAAYEKAGLTEDDALIQARVARILRAEDYNFKQKEVKLWHPLNK